MKNKLPQVYEQFNYINTSGKALDDYLNDFLDEEGEVIYVPEQDWNLFQMVEQ